jgi:hypothetical protein
MCLTNGECFGQGLRQRGRGGPELCVFGNEPAAELLSQREKARVVSCDAIIERCVQGRLVAYAEKMRLKKRSGAIETIARSRGGDVSRPLVRNEQIAEFNQRERSVRQTASRANNSSTVSVRALRT